jgi:hypothetical protein
VVLAGRSSSSVGVHERLVVSDAPTVDRFAPFVGASALTTITNSKATDQSAQTGTNLKNAAIGIGQPSDEVVVTCQP